MIDTKERLRIDALEVETVETQGLFHGVILRLEGHHWRDRIAPSSSILLVRERRKI